MNGKSLSARLVVLTLLTLAPAYRTAVGFVAILLVLTLRPRGLLGERAY